MSERHEFFFNGEAWLLDDDQMGRINKVKADTRKKASELEDKKDWLDRSLEYATLFDELQHQLSEVPLWRPIERWKIASEMVEAKAMRDMAFEKGRVS